jgi:two-component system NtrC family sensor kinase
MTTKPFEEPTHAVALPARACLTHSLPEACACLLAYLADLTPGVVAGWLTVADESLTILRPVASATRPRAEAPLDVEYLEPANILILTAAEARLLYTAFLREQPVHSVPDTALAMPLIARHGKVGALLLRFAGEGPDEAACTLLETAAAVAALPLHELWREDMFRVLERSKQQWEATFDSLRDLLFIHDETGRLLKANRALADRLGVPARELIARPGMFPIHLSSDCTPAFDQPCEWFSETLGATFEALRTPVHDRAQNLIGCVHILRDLTAQKQLEAQMRRNEKLAALGEILSGIAHELNNPLTSIVGYAEMLDNTAPPSAYNAEHLRKIRTEADRAARIVQNLLAFARHQAPQKAPVQINEVVSQTAEFYTYQFQVEQITLRLALAEDLPEIHANFHEIQQVLMNLLTNAFHAVREYTDHGVITLTTETRADGGVRLLVTDNGPGIRPEHRHKLFDPFFTTKEVGQGTGLGLTLCDSILRAHDAAIEALSEYGRGATFQIDFPVNTSQCEPVPAKAVPLQMQTTEECVSQPASADPGARREAATLPLLRIAILDDERILGEMLTEMLTERGHSVACFHAPAEALAALETQAYEVILSDIKMPGMSGMEFYERVAARDPAQAERILFVTGDVLAPQTQAFFARTGCLYIIKPFQSEALSAQIATLLGRCAEAEPVPEYRQAA